MPSEYKIDLVTPEQKEAWEAGYRPLTLPYNTCFVNGERDLLERVVNDMQKPDADGETIIWKLVPTADMRVEVWRKGMKSSYGTDRSSHADGGC